jgi:hypothetical protein
MGEVMFAWELLVGEVPQGVRSEQRRLLWPRREVVLALELHAVLTLHG